MRAERHTGRRGDADVVFVHAKSEELKFIAEGESYREHRRTTGASGVCRNHARLRRSVPGERCGTRGHRSRSECGGGPDGGGILQCSSDSGDSVIGDYVLDDGEYASYLGVSVQMSHSGKLTARLDFRLMSTIIGSVPQRRFRPKTLFTV
jgi:hypothetical protein